VPCETKTKSINVQQAIYGKSNEITAFCDLLDLLNIEGCIVLTDEMHGQKEIAKVIVEKKVNYALYIKNNQSTLSRT